MTEWRVKLRREMNRQDTDANQKAIDSLLNYETVKYFGAEDREAARYDVAMKGYAAAALKTAYSLAALNFGQTVIITTGLITVMVMAAIGVESGQMTVGDFVMVNAYMIQITGPLGFLGTVYREIRQSLVDMGEMFDLLEQPPDVQDATDARDLQIIGGEIRLQDVRFGYDSEREILKGVSLAVGAGQTVAIVGSTGSGKSTIGRLLFRFYDVTGGALTIDGQAHEMGEGGYAFLPPSATWTLTNSSDAPVRFHWIRKAYQAVEGIEAPEAFVTNEQEVTPTAMAGTDGKWATSRFVDPEDLRHDMHVTIVTFEPGAVIPFAETHVMEHGLYVLEGKAVYRLNQDWVEVEAGDYMWLRAFCPQACYAGGPGLFRYLLYKDVNRHMPLAPLR